MGVLTEETLAQYVDPVYNKFVSGEVKVPGKDSSDVRAAGADSQEPSLVNVMLPRTYYPQWQLGDVEKVCEDIARQLLETDEVELDFDQILAKKPRTRDSGMPWHQDAAYWPGELATSKVCGSGTANMWVAVSNVPVESGCMRYVPGSHLEEELRPHEPAPTDANSLRAPVRGEKAVLVPMRRGDVVVHHERVVHGSGPNLTDTWRCGYILNFKRSQCVVEERALGVNHDGASWTRSDLYKNTKSEGKQ